MNKNYAVLLEYVSNQLSYFFPDNVDSSLVLKENICHACQRTEYSISKVKLSGYTSFDYLHSDLYAQFLYFLSNSVWKNSGDRRLASKLFYLNKALHAFNCMYDTELPDVFLLIHCVGTVLGKANYSDYFVACQNVTIGSDRNEMPSMEAGIYMGPGSSIIGKCNIGKNVHLGVNSSVLNSDILEESLVIGVGRTGSCKKIRRNLIDEQYFYR